jgi:hypothetical protein
MQKAVLGLGMLVANQYAKIHKNDICLRNKRDAISVENVDGIEQTSGGGGRSRTYDAADMSRVL